MQVKQKSRFGLYIHVPFCSRLCHYCDFVKTARFEADGPVQYIKAIECLSASWLAAWKHLSGPEAKLDSLFIGGGTPSLLDHEYRTLLSQLQPWLRPGAEVSLEANPEHVTPEKLKLWADFGINRLSLGVQSFQLAGLRFLTREHTPAQVQAAIAMALEYVPNVNIDLIYGWEGQDLQTWQNDLDLALQSGVKHLSLYTLTYEGQTPLARRQRRGHLQSLPDDLLEEMYLAACRSLDLAGWAHEEVSNWHLPGFASVHNSIYWHGDSYIGLGNGAHSFLAEYGGPWGTRWAQDPKIRALYEGLNSLSPGIELSSLLALPGIKVEYDRGPEEWLLETLGTGLRTASGININAICAKTGYSFQPRPSVARALEQGLMQKSPEGILSLVPEEWYRETGWAVEASLSFVPS